MDAVSLNIEKVENTSFTPGLEFQLLNYLKHKFNSNKNIVLTSAAVSDLTLHIEIKDTSQRETEISTSILSYYNHTFSINGKFHLSFKGKSEFDLRFKETHQIQSYSLDLGIVKEKKAFQNILEKISDQIYNRLTTHF